MRNATGPGAADRQTQIPGLPGYEDLDQQLQQLSAADKLLIHAEQTRLLYAAMFQSFLATLVNSLILVFALWDAVDHERLLIWFAIMQLVMGGRIVLAVAYRKHRHDIPASRRWANRFTLGAWLTGIVWGSSTVWLFPLDDPGRQAFLAFVLAGMSAGATTSLAFQRLPIIGYLVFMLFPTAIRFYLLDTVLGLYMSLLTLLFFGVIFLNSLRIYRNTYENIALRLRAVAHERELAASEGKYRTIYNAVPIGIVNYDPDGHIVSCNQVFADMTGVGREVLRDYDLLQNSQAPALREVIRASLAGQEGQYEGRIADLLGVKQEEIRLQCRPLQDADGRIMGAVAIVQDISEDRRIERLKREFVSTISHELRTPLTAIRGAIGLLRGGAAGEVNEEAAKLLSISDANSERLLVLVNDLLDIDRIESGELSFEMKPLAIRPFLEEALRVTATYASQHQVKLQLVTDGGDARVNANHDRLMQIMYNLLSNAVKFSPAAATVEVSYSLSPDMVTLCVADHGPGIAEEFQPLIFERFTQGDASDSRKVGGTGLGLSISRALVERHGGRIWFETGPAGTRFFVSLPRVEAAAPTETQSDRNG